jgi:hypothetical protein
VDRRRSLVAGEAREKTPGTPPVAGGARLALLATIGVTVLLYAVPQLHFVAYPLILIGTLVHELGHGVAAVLVGGTFHSLHVFADGSGVTGWGHQAGEVGRVGRAFVAAGGLIGPAVAAALLFLLARRPGRARWALAAIGVALALTLLLVVRGGFGFALVGILSVVCLALALKASAQVAQLALIFLAVQLSLSVFSRADYLFTDTAHTAAGAHPSDVAHMAEALLLPYWFWGAVCGLFSLAILAAGTWLLIRR